MAHKRSTPGTRKRDERMARLAPVMMEAQLLREEIYNLIGSYGKRKDGVVVEIIGIKSDDLIAPEVEWLAGDEFGESGLFGFEPTTEKPAHMLE